MSELIDKTNYEDLKACDPDEVVKRVKCIYDSGLNCYTVRIWGHDYTVDFNKFRVSAKSEDPPAYQGMMDLFIVYYLMQSKDLPPSGEWVSEKDIPGGAGFFRGPHLVPADLIVKRFGDDLENFINACGAAGGKKLDLADAAFSFEITPTIPVAVLYWQGDEDFPSEAKLLFDRTIQEHCPLDIIFSLAVEVCWRLSKTA